MPAQANGLLNFSASPNEELAVDIYGYYVAPGTPVGPTAQAIGGNGEVTSSSALHASVQAASHPVTQSVQDGNKGQIYLDASVAPFTATGVLMTTPNSSYPWIVARAGTANAASGLCLFNSANTQLLNARSDGAVQLLNGAFLDGRTDYFGSSGSYFGYVAVPTNIVHDVTLVVPRDAAGGATTRVVFYNAQTDGEYEGPNITKYRAVTDAWDRQMHINFDSQIGFHFPTGQAYHFRAFSSREGKDTFWVRPATNATTGNYWETDTRADMYVSGNVGIGTPTPNPSYKLDVVGNVHATGSITADVSIRATFQDVAEWVPSSEQMLPGTVVVVSESAGNTVAPSRSAYDTRVAGVVSAAPGVLLGVESPSKAKIATTGRVKVRVDASKGAIHLGDLLVTSDKPGLAMKSEPLNLGGVKIHRPGTLIGKALEPLPSGQGEILVLLSLQ
jgi:hypothetical protein